MDKILVRQLQLDTIIGLLPWERKLRQRVLVDLDIGTSTQQAAASDDVVHTIDYAKVCEKVAELADAGQFKLIETLAERIARLVLDDFQAQWVRVVVSKVDVLPQTASVGVAIERSAEG